MGGWQTSEVGRFPRTKREFLSGTKIESHFRSKIPVIIVPNFEIVVNQCVPCDVILFYQAENWSRAVHVRPRGFERCEAIFVASFAGLFWALQAPRGVASNWKERHGSTPQICTALHHTLAYLLVSPWFPKNMQFGRLIKLWCMLTGLCWDTVNSFASLFDKFYYMFTCESTSKADKFDNLGSMKILNTPLTQKRSGIRTKIHK